MRQPVVLVIEDDPTTRALLALLLREELGADVVAAADGQAGLARARDVRPDLILLDLLLPGFDGFAFCRRLRAEPALAAVPVLAITALAPADDVRARALAAGCTDVLAKPFDLADILAAAARHLPGPAPADGAAGPAG